MTTTATRELKKRVKDEQEELKTRKEAAAYLRVRPQTLAAWAMTNKYGLPMVKVGRSVRYRTSDLDEFLRRRTVGGDVAGGK